MVANAPQTGIATLRDCPEQPKRLGVIFFTDTAQREGNSFFNFACYSRVHDKHITDPYEFRVPYQQLKIFV